MGPALPPPQVDMHRAKGSINQLPRPTSADPLPGTRKNAGSLTRFPQSLGEDGEHKGWRGSSYITRPPTLTRILWRAPSQTAISFHLVHRVKSPIMEMNYDAKVSRSWTMNGDLLTM
jgi:hypothetical protein